MLFFLGVSFCLGLIFGSFSTVLIERWRSGKWGIMMWRSECPNCNTILGTRDLFPIFSYIWTRGRCSHCGTKISLFYPVAELTMGIIFTILAYSAISIGIDPISPEMLLLLVFGFATGVYILYDIRYMEIPDQIMVPMILILLAIPFFSLLFIGYSEYTFHTFPISIYDRFFWAIVLYTFLYLQILIPWGYYLIRQRDWRHLGELMISYIGFPILIIIDFFRQKKSDEDTLEIPTWVGWGDLRVALFIGLTLGTLHGISSFAFAYIIGSIVWVVLLGYNAIQWKKTKSQIPFGPFLGLGWVLSILFYNEIIILYNIFFIYQ